jgi:UDP-glucose 4-epimerase
MAVLVTGGAGYIGSHMVWALLDAGEDVVVIDRLSTGFRWAVAPRARFYLGDVSDAALLHQIFAENDIETILHFAGSIIVPQSVANPLDYYENNTGNTRALAAAAIANGVKNFVFSSTAAVYGSQQAEGPVSETAVLSPENPYGLSKLMAEIMLRDAASAHDFRYVALRYFNVAGADLKGRAGLSTEGASHLLKVACEAAMGKRPKIDIYGTDYPTHDGTGVRDYIHVSDLVDAHLLAIGYLRDGGEPLIANCGYGHGYSVLDVIEAVRREYGRSFKVDYCGRRAGDVASMVADASRAQTMLGWQPRFDDLATIVRSALDWEEALVMRAQTDIGAIQRRLAVAGYR